jgi:uncharacterized protein with HEPN domain
MQKGDLFYIRHIEECLRKIQQYTHSYTEADFLRNTLFRMP